MKGLKVIIIVVLTALTVIGWGSVGANRMKLDNEYNSDIKNADQWAADGLYQRAIQKYKDAIAQNDSQETWTKLLDAYAKRYEEDTGILSDYVSAAEDATVRYPKNSQYLKTLVSLYMDSSNYSGAYKYICNAIENGNTDKEIYNLKNQIQYSYKTGTENYVDVKSAAGSFYTVSNGELWGSYGVDGSVGVDCSYEYINSCGDNQTRVYTTQKDSRLIDGDGMVLGIFGFKVTEAGLYSEGLIPVAHEGKYKYYDSFAKESFGDYDFAGGFKNGIAPVKKGNDWLFVDTSGKEKGEHFADVVTDDNGNCFTGSVIIAAKEQGKYGMFDGDLKSVCNFTADEMDLCMSDDLIAFKSNDKWGYVNTEGKVIIEPQYEAAKSFSNGLAAVCKEGAWGFINSKNETVIDYEFADADYFNSSGSCMVRTDVPNVEDEVVWQLIILNLGIK